ncbi:hypothetical protein HRTV-9_gp82 [Halorubrum virus HRTV-9]|nr:hypothetical protein HRTV-9_gp82 [Halorubrum virus HRTV-9]
MAVKTDTTGNHVGPDLTKYDWEYCPIDAGHSGYDFRLYNDKKEVCVEVYPEGDDPENGYNIVVREVEFLDNGDAVDGYPVFNLHAESGWFMEMMCALATAISWVEERNE